jgi:hypothetical protein
MRSDSSRPGTFTRRSNGEGAARRHTVPRRRAATSGARRCRRKFLSYFPDGFRDQSYLALEREYKWQTHLRWQAALGVDEFSRLIRQGEFREIAARAVRVEQRSRHSMIFSFEKMALRDAVRSEAGARAFAQGLFDLVHGEDALETRFERWCQVVGSLPRKKNRVLTWPLVTVFGYIAQPARHMFMKPMVTRSAARQYGFDLRYRSRPGWDTYSQLLEFAEVVRCDQRDLKPRDMIDLQSFMWVQGSDEYD